MASDHDIGAIECAAMLARVFHQEFAFRAELATRWKPGAVHGALEFTSYDDDVVMELWTELTVNAEHDHVVWSLDIVPGDVEWRVETSAYFKHHQTEKQKFFLHETHRFQSFETARDAMPGLMRALLATTPEIERFLARDDDRQP